MKQYDKIPDELLEAIKWICDVTDALAKENNNHIKSIVEKDMEIERLKILIKTDETKTQVELNKMKRWIKRLFCAHRKKYMVGNKFYCPSCNKIINRTKV